MLKKMTGTETAFIYIPREEQSFAKIKKYEGCYPEDYPHENGNYINICRKCGNEFFGHKRRVWCKLCLNDSSSDSREQPRESIK